MLEDPFPRGRFVAMLRRLPYCRLSWRLARPAASRSAVRPLWLPRATRVADRPRAGRRPRAGPADDIAVAIATIRFALDGLSPERRRIHLAAAGLRDEDLVADVRTVGATTTWILRASARTAARVTVASGRLAAGAGRRARDLAAPRVTVIRRRLPGRLRGPAEPDPGRSDPDTGVGA
jgi:hypothetical protein